MTLRSLAVCLINPKFEPSFWGYDFALPLTPGDKRGWVITGALPALAALAPPHCSVTFIDENVEAIAIGELARFDVIGVTGMIVQGKRMKELLSALRPLPANLVVGWWRSCRRHRRRRYTIGCRPSSGSILPIPRLHSCPRV